MELALARSMAWSLVERLAPSCDRIEIAGSIRRDKPDVKDIELVVKPKFVEAPMPEQASFLNTAGPGRINAVDEAVRGWLDWGFATPRLDRNGHAAIGSSYKRLLVKGTDGDWYALDLFSVIPPAQWGLIFLIRTGSGVGPSGSARDGFGPAMLGRWKQVSGGGFSKDGCLRLPDGKMVFTLEEEDVFRVCHVVWVPPEERVDRGAVKAVG